MTLYRNIILDVHRKKVEVRRRMAIGMAGLSTTVAVLATSMSFAPEAQAAPRFSTVAPTRVSRISYHDLDLTRHRDVLVLRDRVKVAARRVCRLTPAMVINREGFGPYCFAQAMADGTRQIDRAAYGAVLARRNTLSVAL